MRYLIIFLIGFFLGGFYNGNFLAFGKKVKDLVFKKERSQSIVYEREAETRAPRPRAKAIRRTAPVVKTAPREQVPVQRARVSDGHQKVYTVQVASFKRMEQAKKLVRSLTHQEYDAYIAPKNPSKPDDFYRVCVGESISHEQAKIMNRRLKSKFKDSFVYSF